MVKRNIYILNLFLCFILCVIAIFTITKFTNKGKKKVVEKNNQTELGTKILSSEKNYKLHDLTRDGKPLYIYEIYNESGQIVKNEKVERSCPALKYLSDTLLSIEISAGTNLCLTQYYDIKADKFSEIFQTPLATQNNKVVYMKDSETLIVRDIFDESRYVKEFRLDFSTSAVPATLIKEAEFVNDDKLKITYLSGEDYNETTEMLLLN